VDGKAELDELHLSYTQILIALKRNKNDALITSSLPTNQFHCWQLRLLVTIGKGFTTALENDFRFFELR
jgi:hypothetical protein